MPLIKGKSKKSFEHNIKAEISAGKSQPQALAIAYSMKRKAPKKKMAEGGEAKTATSQRPDRSDLDHGQKRGPQGYPKYQEQAQNEKGVHTSVSGTTGYPGMKGTSRAGDYVKDRYAGEPTYAAGKDHPARKEHKRVIEESRKIKPKLQGLAQGGMIEEDIDDAREVAENRHMKPAHEDSITSQPERKQAAKGMRTTAINHPRMAHSDILQSRLMSEEDDLEMSAHPASDKEQPSRMDNEKRPDRHGPSVHKMKMMSKGGSIEDADHLDDIHNKSVDHEFGDGAEEDEQHDPAHLKEDNDEMAPPEKEFMASKFAEGGMAREEDEQPIDEEELEHAASIAAAIMARNRRKFASGGMVDLSENADEEPNHEDDESFEALKKENYSESAGLDALHDPEDSNELGDSEEEHEENDHDKSVVSAIRSKMKKRSAIIR